MEAEDFRAIVDAYSAKFGRSHTLVGLDEQTLEEAAKLMAQAITLDVPYKDDADFYDALGLDPPPIEDGIDI